MIQRKTTNAAHFVLSINSQPCAVIPTTLQDQAASMNPSPIPITGAHTTAWRF
jgi:hypothetical protein